MTNLLFFTAEIRQSLSNKLLAEVNTDDCLQPTPLWTMKNEWGSEHWSGCKSCIQIRKNVRVFVLEKSFPA